MGLDMYFKARLTEHYNFYFDGEEDKTNYPKDLLLFQNLIDFKSTHIKKEYTIGYFWKFNALHSYIIDTFADGIDICQEIFLDKKDIEHLLNICEIIKNDPSQAPLLMQTQKGFFFGSTNYDEYYFKNIDIAASLFSKILENIDFDEYDIFYRASW